jgi:hypothetical protein
MSEQPDVDRIDQEEEWPLSPIDDYPIHQTVDPIRVVWTSDIRMYDRHWMVAHSVKDDLLLVIGGSVYPNLDMAEGYAIVNIHGTHTAVRATRALGADRMDLGIGPIRPTIVRGLREWHYEIGENDQDLEFDLRWFDTNRHQPREPHPGPVGGGSPRGRQRDQTGGFEGFGEVEGWVRVGDRRVELDRSTCRGTRDRHWGVRNGVGGPEQLLGARPPRGGNGHQFIDFGDWAIWADRVYHPFGSTAADEKIVHIERRFRFEDDTQLFVEGVVENTFESGTTKVIHYRRVGDITGYLRCGFYGGPNGGAPGSDWWQGQLPADRPVEGETVDVTTTEGKLYLSGLNEHLCIATCDGEEVGGVIQTYDPNAQRRCLNQIPGWRLL